MDRHIKVYSDFFEIDCHNPKKCEITGYTRGIDIHHIWGRGEGKDVPENLMAIRRDLHIKCGQNEKYNDWLEMVHSNFMETRLSLYEQNSRDEIYLELMGMKLFF